MASYWKYDATVQNGMEGLKSGLGGATSDWALKLNAVEQSASFFYHEGDITATPTWPAKAGSTLVVGGSGTGDPARDYGPVGATTADYSVLFGGSGKKILQYASSGYGACNKYDMVLALALKVHADTYSKSVIGDLGSSGGGWRVRVLLSGTPQIYFDSYNDTPTGTSTNCGALVAGTVNFVVFTLNESDSKIRVYVNGATSLSASWNWQTGTMTENQGLAVGWDTVGASQAYNDRIIGAAQWVGSGWLSGVTDSELSSFGREASSRFWGTYLSSSNDDKYPSTQSRDIEASLLRKNADGNTRLWYIGKNAIAKSYLPRKGGGSADHFLDVLPEGIVNNVSAGSDNDPDGSDWTPSYVSVGSPYLQYDASKQNGMEALKVGLGTGNWDINANGSNVGASIILLEKDLTATPTWPEEVGGQTLVVGGGGSGDPSRTYGPVGPTTADYAAKFDGTGKDFLIKALSGHGAIGKDDFLIVTMFRCIAISGNGFAGHIGSSSGGWTLHCLGTLGSTAYVRLWLANDTSGNAYAITAAGSLEARAWNCLVIAGNVTNSTARGYLNGTLSASPGISWSGTVTEDTGLAIGGGYTTDAGAHWGNIANFGLWHSAGWWSGWTTSEIDALAKNITSRMLGAQLASSNNNLYPSTMTRASQASLLRKNADGATRIYYLGNNGIAKAYSALGTSGTAVHYLNARPNNVNNEIGSTSADDPNGADWTRTRVTRSSGTISTPDPDVSAYGLDTDSADGNNTHIIYCSKDVTAQSGCFAVVAKKGAKDWIKLRLVASGWTERYVYFNLNTGAIGTVYDDPPSYGMIPLGDGWYLCWIGRTLALTSASESLYIADADNDDTYTGTDSTDIYFFRACVLDGYPTPVCLPHGGETINADTLTYPIDEDDTATGRAATNLALMYQRLVTIDYDIWEISDGGSSADAISLRVGATSNQIDLLTRKTAGDAGDATVTGYAGELTGPLINYRGRWDTDDVRLDRDDVIGTADSAADPPINLDQLQLMYAISKLSLYTGTAETPISSPDPDVDAYGLLTESADGSQTHKITLPRQTLAGEMWYAACLVKAGSKSWCDLWDEEYPGGAKFNLSTGATTVTTSASVSDGGYLSLGSSWFLIWITGVGGGFREVGLRIRHDTSTLAYVGTDSIDIYFNHFVLADGDDTSRGSDQGLGRPATFPAGGTTRLKDNLKYPVTSDDSQEGSILVVTSLYEEWRNGQHDIFAIIDSATSDDWIGLSAQKSTSRGMWTAWCQVTTGTDGGLFASPDLVITDGDLHTGYIRWKTGAGTHFYTYAEASDATNATYDIPDSLDTIEIYDSVKSLEFYSAFGDAGASTQEMGLGTATAASQAMTAPPGPVDQDMAVGLVDAEAQAMTSEAPDFPQQVAMEVAIVTAEAIGMSIGLGTYTVPTVGGATLELVGTWDTTKTYTIRIGTEGSVNDAPCYSGVVGNGYGCISTDGVTLTCISPPLPRGELYIVSVDDGTTFAVVASVNVVESPFHTGIYWMRRQYPRWYETGPRLPEYEPRQDEQASAASPKISIPLTSPSVDNVPAQMTLNGISVLPTVRYRGGDATSGGWSAWGYGGAMSYAFSGSDCYFNHGSPLLGNSDDAVQFNNGRGYLSSGATPCNPGTKCFVIEALVRCSGAIEMTIDSGKGSTAAGTPGWLLYSTATSYYFSVADGVLIATPQFFAASPGQWHLLHLVFGPGHIFGCRTYVNGKAVSASSTIGFSAVTSSNALAFGGYYTGAFKSQGGAIAYFAYYDYQSWFAAPPDMDDAIRERASTVFGLMPEVSLGTAAPTTVSRSWGAYLEKEETEGLRPYHVGPDWPRISQSGTETGYNPEYESENRCLYSQDFDVNGSGNPWTHQICSVSANSTTAPDKTLTADTIHEDGTWGAHRVGQNIYMWIGEMMVWSCWVKALNRFRVRLEADIVSTNPIADFNLSTGVATLGGAGGVDAYMRAYRDDWWRCVLVYTGNATGNGFHSVQVLDDAGNGNFTGSDQDSLYVWGAQRELAVRWASSYIYTTSVIRTRPIDRLTYAADDGNLPAGLPYDIRARVTLPDGPSSEDRPIVCLSDGTSSNRTLLYAKATTGVAEVATAKSGGDAGLATSTTVIAGSTTKDVRAFANTDALAIYIEGQQEDSDLDVDPPPPSVLTDIDIGTDESGTTTDGLRGLISNVKVY